MINCKCSFITESGSRLILTDSIGKRVKVTQGATVFFRGDTIGMLGDRVVHGQVDVTGHAKILIHVGINDIISLINSKCKTNITVHDILRRFKCLREIIRRRNTYATLLFSAILPRDSRQFHLYSSYLYGVNFALEKWCAKSGGSCVFLDTCKLFVDNGSPRDELFARSDGLHPNGMGDDRLQAFYSQALSTAYIIEKVKSKRVKRLRSLPY